MNILIYMLFSEGVFRINKHALKKLSKFILRNLKA